VTGDTLEITRPSLQHPGIPASVEGHYAVSAAVALQRHHQSPASVEVQMGQDVREYDAEWRPPTPDELRACAAERDTTCYGAYTVALAAIFQRLGYKAVARAAEGDGSQGSGSHADWLLLPVDAEVDEWYLEHPDIRRVEISGQDEASFGERNWRLKKKIDQAQGGLLRHIPAWAAVVEFSLPVVAIAQAS